MRQAIGKPIAALDAQIAAVCIQHDATLVTRKLIDPW
jgi:predicted nucleic acid-binding protein